MGAKCSSSAVPVAVCELAITPPALNASMQTHRADVLAYDREKRVYKDAYVENFRRVRHFPSLATIGTGRSDGDSIILIQDPAAVGGGEGMGIGAAGGLGSRTSKYDDVPSKLLPVAPLSDVFESTPPLSVFRHEVLCKHTRARQERDEASALGAASMNSRPAQSAFSPRYGARNEKAAFKPCNAVEAKAMIERQASYDLGDNGTRPGLERSLIAPEGKPQWSFNNPTTAKEDLRSRAWFHEPPDGVIKADRRYTQEFIRQHVDAYQLSRQRATPRRR